MKRTEMKAQTIQRITNKVTGQTFEGLLYNRISDYARMKITIGNAKVRTAKKVWHPSRLFLGLVKPGTKVTLIFMGLKVITGYFQEITQMPGEAPIIKVRPNEMKSDFIAFRTTDLIGYLNYVK